jgi:hypothetical protein
LLKGVCSQAEIETKNKKKTEHKGGKVAREKA